MPRRNEKGSPERIRAAELGRELRSMKFEHLTIRERNRAIRSHMRHAMRPDYGGVYECLATNV